MKDIGIRVEPVGPNDRSGILVDADLPEVVRVAQWLTQRSVHQRRSVEVSHQAVAEGEALVVVVERLVRRSYFF